MSTVSPPPSGSGGPVSPEDHPVNLQRASYAEILDALPDPVFLCTPEGDVLYWNRRAREVAGYPDEEIAGVNLMDLVPEKLRPALRDKLTEVVETGAARLELPVVTGVAGKAAFEVTGSLTTRGQDTFICGIARDVTERRTRQEDLRQRERHFRLLVEQVEEYAIFMLGPDGHVQTWNEGAETIKGYSEDEILGEHFSIFYPQADVEEGKPSRALQTAESEGQWVDEGWRVRADGSRFWARVTVTALYDEKELLQGFAKVTRDMTERRKWEEELRQSERRYRLLFEESQEGIAITTPDGEVVDANAAAIRMLGYSREDVEDIDVADIYVDPDVREWAKMIMEQEGAIRGLYARLRRKDGEEIICQLSSTPRRGPQGEVQVFQTFFRDVTEQKRTQEALVESERRHRRLFEESRDAIVLTTPEGDILEVNEAAEELFGYPREEFLELDAAELYAESKERRRFMPTLLESESAETLEARMRHKDGHTFLASATVTVHRDGEGTVELIQALVRDVTKERQLQRDVLRAQEEERKRLGRDLHDGVASQLTGISMLLGTAAEEIGTDHPAHRRIQRAQDLIQESGEDVRRLSRGLAPLSLSDVGLVDTLRRLADNSDSCHTEVDGDLPDLTDEQQTHLYWIAQEAVTNAGTYAAADEIVIGLEASDGEIVLTVEDDGQGFDPSCFGASGLGLRTMKYRAELLGGEFTLDTAPGAGTRVECRLRPHDG